MHVRLLFVVLAAMVVFACAAEEEGTNGGPIDGVPSEVNNFFGQADLDKLKEAGMNINTGINPPDITGTYLGDTLVISYDDTDATGMSVSRYQYTFYDQTAAGAIKVDYTALDAADVATGTGGFISGEGTCFSIYLDTKGVADTCNYKTPNIISGCLNTSGDITSWQQGLIMTEKEGSCDTLIPVGHRRIISETDGTVTKTSASGKSGRTNDAPTALSL